MLRLAIFPLFVQLISTSVHANEQSKPSERSDIWQAPSLSAELPETTRSDLKNHGLAFIPKKELPAGGGRGEYSQQDPFKALLAKDKKTGRMWGRVMAATRRAGLLSKETVKIANGVVHTLPSIKRATNGPGSETSRTLYLGGKLFVKGGGLIAPFRERVGSYIMPKIDPSQPSHEPFGGAQWFHLKKQFKNHVWMHAVTLELFGELANTAVPLRMTQLTAARLPDGSIVEQEKILTEKSFWPDQKEYVAARKSMRKHLGARSKRWSPEKISQMWIQHQQPAQMIYLFRRGRDLLTRIRGSAFLADNAPHSDRPTRLRSAIKELRCYARNHGAWIALGLDSMRDGNDPRGSRDLSRGFITDLDVTARSSFVKPPSVPEKLVEKVAGFYLTREEYDQVQAKLTNIANAALFMGWKAALSKIVFSDRKTDLVSRTGRMKLRAAWMISSWRKKYLPAKYKRTLRTIRQTR